MEKNTQQYMHGTIVTGLLYYSPSEQGEDPPLLAGLSLQLSCRAGEYYCTISQFTNNQGDILDALESGEEARFQAVTLPKVHVTMGMPFSLKADGVIIAEGAVLAILRRGR